MSFSVFTGTDERRVMVRDYRLNTFTAYRYETIIRSADPGTLARNGIHILDTPETVLEQMRSESEKYRSEDPLHARMDGRPVTIPFHNSLALIEQDIANGGREWLVIPDKPIKAYWNKTPNEIFELREPFSILLPLRWGKAARGVDAFRLNLARRERAMREASAKHARGEG